ncbi:PKD domain-containing protein [Leifsonia aquatica]|uniref:PKD domain-containing protein n=1 Tax=Leifsonia aquatica TaxID=144185 RepID=UPI0038106569
MNQTRRRRASVLSGGVVAVAVLVTLTASPVSAAPVGSWPGIVIGQTVDQVVPFTASTVETAGYGTPLTITPAGQVPSYVNYTPDGGTAYISDPSAAGGVHVVDAAATTVQAEIPAGSYTYDIAISPNGARAYTPRFFNDVLVEIDTASNSVARSIPVGALPYSVAVTPDGAHAYVTNNGDNTVSVIDTATGTVTATIPVGAGPFGTAAGTDGAFVYTADGTSNTVSVIATATDAVAATIPVSAAPRSLAADPAGAFLLVGSTSGNVVDVIDTASNAVITQVPVGANPQDIAFTPDGATAYVTSFAGSVTPIDTTTWTARPAIAGPTTAFGIAIAPDQAPTAVLAPPASVALGSASTFDGSGSTSPVGDIASYAWDFGDGTTTTTTTPTTTHTYAVVGSYSVTLTVTNTAGTSTTIVYTGQSVARNGGPTAITTTTAAVTPAAPAPAPTPPPGTAATILLADTGSPAPGWDGLAAIALVVAGGLLVAVQRRRASDVGNR